MVSWKNLDTLASYKKLMALKGRINLVEVMSGENGAKRVAEYNVPMACGLKYNYAAKLVDDEVLSVLQELADEAQLTEKYKELYNGAVINTGEKRLVLHQLCRGQQGDDVMRSPMIRARHLPLSYRSVSAAATSVPALCIWRSRTGRSRMASRRWKPDSSATSIPMTQQPF